MSKMISLVAGCKWVVLAVTLAACGGADMQPGAGHLAGSDGGSAGAAASQPVTSAAGAANELGQAGAIGDAGGDQEVAVDVEAGGAPSDGKAGASSAGSVSVSVGGAASTGGDTSVGGSFVSGGGASAAGSGSAGAPPVCACSTGECCDGCNFRPSTFLVASHQVHYVRCPAGAPSHSIGYQYGDLYCGGKDAGPGANWKDTTYSAETCPGGNDVCVYPDEGTPHCGPL